MSINFPRFNRAIGAIPAHQREHAGFLVQYRTKSLPLRERL
jgi:hypothetical protein